MPGGLAIRKPTRRIDFSLGVALRHVQDPKSFIARRWIGGVEIYRDPRNISCVVSELLAC